MPLPSGLEWLTGGGQCDSGLTRVVRHRVSDQDAPLGAFQPQFSYYRPGFETPGSDEEWFAIIMDRSTVKDREVAGTSLFTGANV